MFVGEFEIKQPTNDWHYVTISFNSATNVYKWKNRAGKIWTLYPQTNNTLRVGEDCPYFGKGHTSALFSSIGVYGPWNVLYQRIGKNGFCVAYTYKYKYTYIHCYPTCFLLI